MISIVAAVVVASSWSLARAREVRCDGPWEVSMQMDLPNAPIEDAVVQGRPLRDEGAGRDPNQLPKGGQDKNKDRRVSDYNVAGNTVTWTVP